MATETFTKGDKVRNTTHNFNRTFPNHVGVIVIDCGHFHMVEYTVDLATAKCEAGSPAHAARAHGAQTHTFTMKTMARSLTAAN